MGRMTIKGLDEFTSRIEVMGRQGIPIAKTALYDGAAVLIEAVKKEINELPEQEGYMVDGVKRHYVTANEKRNLLEHVGISHMKEEDGKVSVRIGFDGYTDYTTKAYPQGLPISMLARSIVKGTSVHEKDDFIKKAVDQARENVQRTMIQTAENAINNIK